MRIGIDFDRVLFDTESFDEYYKDQTGLFHVEEKVCDDNGNYDPEKHAVKCGIDPDNVWAALDNLEDFLYNDVEKLKKLQNNDLVLVTRGNRKFQKRKIDSSGVKKYVDEVVIVNSGSKAQAEIDFLVDDLEKEVDRVDVPGFLFDREKHSIDDIIRKVNQLDG